MTPSVDVQQIVFAHRPGYPVLRDVTFTVPTGSFLVIVGPNGAGKSTLIGLMAGLLKPQAGHIFLEGLDIRTLGVRDLARMVAIVRQDFVPVFGFSVAEVVLMARTSRYGPFGFESKTDREHAMKALELTETAPFASRPLASLSAGERQRVFIARALAQDTPILLMDEPTSYLDLKHRVAILDLLKTIQIEEARTIVAVTHDINLAAQYGDRALLLRPITEARTPTTDRGGPAKADHYRIGPTSEVFTEDGIGEAFATRIFSGPIGREKFFLPLGRMAKDAAQAERQRSSPRDAPKPPRA